MTDETADNVVDMDELFQREINEAEVNEINKRAAAPQGTYTTVPDEYPLNVFVNEIDEKVNGEPTGTKRLILTVTGMAQGVFKGETVNLRLRFGISPDQRAKRNFDTGEEIEGKDDLKTRLYAQAVTTYKASVGDAPKKLGDLVEFLKSSPYKVRTFNTTEGDSMVIAISPARRRR